MKRERNTKIVDKEKVSYIILEPKRITGIKPILYGSILLDNKLLHETKM